MPDEVDWKVAADLEDKSKIPHERIIAAVKGQGSKSSGPRPKGYGKQSSKDAGPKQYKKPGKKSAKGSGPREYKKG